MAYPGIIPDAPIPLSMLPAAASLKKTDLLYLVQPGNPIGQRSKSLTLGALTDSDVFRFEGVRNAVTKSNILAYTGALARTSTGNYTEICHLDIDPRLDVEFHVWGTSDTAGAGGYTYGLRGKTEQYYEYEDIGKVLEAFYFVGKKTDTVDIEPRYNVVFGLNPFNYVFSPNFPTKRVTLYLSTGTSFNPYQADEPTSFSLNIQATIYPSKYVNNILKATT